MIWIGLIKNKERKKDQLKTLGMTGEVIIFPNL